MLIARSCFGANALFLVPKDVHVVKRQQVSDLLNKALACHRQIFLPFDAGSREASMNLWSIASSCDSSVVPWLFVYERRSLICVHSMDQLVRLFLSRIMSPIFLVRARRGYSSAIGRPADMTRNEFISRVGHLFSVNSRKETCLEVS